MMDPSDPLPFPGLMSEEVKQARRMEALVARRQGPEKAAEISLARDRRDKQIAEDDALSKALSKGEVEKVKDILQLRAAVDKGNLERHIDVLKQELQVQRDAERLGRHDFTDPQGHKAIRDGAIGVYKNEHATLPALSAALGYSLGPNLAAAKTGALDPSPERRIAAEGRLMDAVEAAKDAVKSTWGTGRARAMAMAFEDSPEIAEISYLIPKYKENLAILPKTDTAYDRESASTAFWDIFAKAGSYAAERRALYGDQPNGINPDTKEALALSERHLKIVDAVLRTIEHTPSNPEWALRTLSTVKRDLENATQGHRIAMRYAQMNGDKQQEALGWLRTRTMGAVEDLRSKSGDLAEYLSRQAASRGGTGTQLNDPLKQARNLQKDVEMLRTITDGHLKYLDQQPGNPMWNDQARTLKERLHDLSMQYNELRLSATGRLDNRMGSGELQTPAPPGYWAEVRKRLLETDIPGQPQAQQQAGNHQRRAYRSA